MKNVLRLLILAVGLGVFGWFVQRAGPAGIWQTISGLGWRAPLVLLPLAVVYGMETWGWRFAFGRDYPPGIPYPTLYRIRLCGEAVNNVVPSGTVGGEILKVYLLHKRGANPANATTATIAGRTVQTLMQVIFITLGAAAFLHVARNHDDLRPLLIVVLILCVGLVAAMFHLQTHGMFTLLLRLATRLPWRWNALLANREKLLRIDRQVLAFYGRHRRHFLLSATAYLSAWLLDTLDVVLVAWLLGIPIQWPQALVIEAFIGVVRLLGFLVPGSIGIQETGITLVCGLVGLPAQFGPTYAIIRRGRDLSFALLGWSLLYWDESNLTVLREQVREEAARDL